MNAPIEKLWKMLRKISPTVSISKNGQLGDFRIADIPTIERNRLVWQTKARVLRSGIGRSLDLAVSHRAEMSAGEMWTRLAGEEAACLVGERKARCLVITKFCPFP
jgi:hypothetical protein